MLIISTLFSLFMFFLLHFMFFLFFLLHTSNLMIDKHSIFTKKFLDLRIIRLEKTSSLVLRQPRNIYSKRNRKVGDHIIMFKCFENFYFVELVLRSNNRYYLHQYHPLNETHLDDVRGLI